ncbi:MAG: hydroxymethylpyrimidine/phosphomethylpyrimidine kinase, partial [Halobaculum sp.]
MRRAAPDDRPVVLTVAGSDSGGGAGVQADLKTAAAVGAFGTSVVTSVTAQHTRGVESTHVLPVAEVEAQLDAVFDDFDVAAVKTGMLATTEIVETVAEYAAERDVPFVVDPVMVAASGDRLLAPEAESAYERLIAEATVVTPNADEAAVLTDIEPASEADLRAVGEQLVSAGASAALVKGGHVAGDPVCDVLVRRVNDGDPVQRTNEGDPVQRTNEGDP